MAIASAEQKQSRKAILPVLRYWHCKFLWNLEEGPDCPMEHDVPINDYRARRGRLRRTWLCPESGLGFPSRKAFLEHDEGESWA